MSSTDVAIIVAHFAGLVTGVYAGLPCPSYSGRARASRSHSRVCRADRTAERGNGGDRRGLHGESEVELSDREYSRMYMQQYAAVHRAAYERGDLLPPREKRCSTCREVKGANCFSLYFYSPDLLAYNCKVCNRYYVAERRAIRACEARLN